MTDAQMTTAAPSRLDRLTTGVRELKIGRSGRLALGEHTLMTIGGIIAPLGLVLVLIGWYGAARTPNLFEQVPYLISGGLFGLSLVILGGFLYFAHWLTQLIRETRAQSEAVTLAFERLEAVMRQQAELVAATAPAAAPVAAPRPGRAARRSEVPADVTGPVSAPALVATAKGTMAHRPDCVVVAGKAGLRSVAVGEDLQPCKLCDSGSASPT